MVSNRGPSAYQPNALPPGQTSSRLHVAKATYLYIVTESEVTLTVTVLVTITIN